MNLYAESSAVLSWLLGEADNGRVRRALAQAGTIVSSDLTLIECDRALHRGVETEIQSANRRALLNQAAAHWLVLKLFDEIVERSRRPFPVEPIRTLDAIHLASALVVRVAFPDLVVLSLDHRLRSSAHELGFEVLPA